MNEWWVWLTFRIIDLSIISGLIIYLYRRYMSADLSKKMTDQAARWQALEEQLVGLQQEVHTLDQAVIEDQQESKQLEEQVMVWQKQIAQHKAARVAQKEQVRAQLMQVEHKRIASLRQQQIRAQAVPQAMAQARKALTERFAGNQHEAAAYLDRIVDTMTGDMRPDMHPDIRKDAA